MLNVCETGRLDLELDESRRFDPATRLRIRCLLYWTTRIECERAPVIRLITMTEWGTPTSIIGTRP